MTPIEPPFATWLLKHLGRRNDALTGDLVEEYGRGRSRAWYRRQVLTAVILSRRAEFLLAVGILAVYLTRHYVPIPGANTTAWSSLARQTTFTGFQFFDLFAGGNFAPVTIFALGIMPYVTASILVQLLAWRSFRSASTPVRRSIRQYTRVVAILLSAIQAYGIAIFLERLTAFPGGLSLVYNPGWIFRVTTVLTLTSGTVTLMCLSDYITVRGFGNGMFLIFIAGLLAGLPDTVSTLAALTRATWIDGANVLAFVVQVVGSVAVVAITSHSYQRALQPDQSS